MCDGALKLLITQGLSRISAEMARVAPFMATRVTDWLAQISGSNAIEDHFEQPLGFPLRFPWWLANHALSM